MKLLGPLYSEYPKLYISPLEVFTGIHPVLPLLRTLPNRNYQGCSDVTGVRALQTMKFERLRTALIDVHRDWAELISAVLQEAIKYHNQKTIIPAYKFHKGAVFPVRLANYRGHKLSKTCIGPMRIANSKSLHVLEIEYLVLRLP